MTIERRVLKSTSECDELRQYWQCLLTQCPHVTPFHTYEWTRPNLSTFANEGIFVFAFLEDESLVGILPLVLRRGRRYLRTRSWLEFAGLPHADYGGILVRRGYEAGVAQSLIEFLKTDQASWEVVQLDRLSQAQDFVQALVPRARQEGWHISVRQSDSVRRLSKEDYFQNKLDATVSRSLEKARRKLAVKGEVVFEVFDGADAIHPHLETFARLHIDRFAALGIHSPWASPTHRNFYEQMIADCAEAGYVWLSRLTCGGIPAAMRISLRCDETLHLYSTCFPAEFEKYSPSRLQLEMLLDYAFHHGISVVDFGIGESPHKLQAGSVPQAPMQRVEISHRWPASIESQLYDWAERASTKFPLLRRGGKVLRKVFPYGG